MADRKDKKGRRAYLNDFREDINGQFVYEGTVYRLREEGRSAKSFRTELYVLAALMTLGTVLSGCLPVPCMLEGFLCTFCYVGELIAAFLMLWSMFGMRGEINELRGYIFEKSIGSLPQRSFLIALFAVLGLIASVIYIMKHGTESKTAMTVLFMVIKLMTAAAAWRMHKTVRGMVWDNT